MCPSYRDVCHVEGQTKRARIGRNPGGGGDSAYESGGDAGRLA